MKRIFSLMLLCAAVIFAGCSKDNPDPDPTPIPVASVTLDKASLSLEIAKTATLVATITPKDAAVTAVVWSSDKPAVATVNDKGVVTAVAEGTATITVKTEDGGKTATCTVTVVKAGIAITEVKLNKAEISIAKGKTETLTMTVLPDDATDKTVIWASSDETVATVANGVVTAVKEGEATITVASVADDTKKAICKVKVTTVNYIEVNGIKVALGNLVADGPNGAKIGAPTDGGLYFQFGSLIGWAGGTTGDGTGMPTSNTPGYRYYAVVPLGKSIPATTEDPERWKGTAGNVPAENDACTKYLGSPWRLPTKDELGKLFGNTNLYDQDWSDTAGWSFVEASKSATHTDGLAFPASGYRLENGNLEHVGSDGFCWSASPYNVGGDFDYSGSAFDLCFGSDFVAPNDGNSRNNWFPVRCVR